MFGLKAKARFNSDLSRLAPIVVVQNYGPAPVPNPVNVLVHVEKVLHLLLCDDSFLICVLLITDSWSRIGDLRVHRKQVVWQAKTRVSWASA